MQVKKLHKDERNGIKLVRYAVYDKGKFKGYLDLTAQPKGPYREELGNISWRLGRKIVKIETIFKLFEELKKGRISRSRFAEIIRSMKWEPCIGA